MNDVPRLPKAVLDQYPALNFLWDALSDGYPDLEAPMQWMPSEGW
jgi:hypothetical protein